jgi:hypothetical protein
MKCFNCRGTGFDSHYIEEYKKAGYTKEMTKDSDGYNIAKCHDCKGTGVMNVKPLFYEVIDTYNGSRHTGWGIMARVRTIREAKALQASIDGKWDGCEGSLKIKIKAIYEKEFGLERVKHNLCKHDWQNEFSRDKGFGLGIRHFHLEKGLYECTKCEKRNRPSNYPNKKLPAYDGIGYWDEINKKLIIPKKKEWIDVNNGDGGVKASVGEELKRENLE